MLTIGKDPNVESEYESDVSSEGRPWSETTLKQKETRSLTNTPFLVGARSQNIDEAFALGASSWCRTAKGGSSTGKSKKGTWTGDCG